MKEALSEEADIVACHISHVYPDGACLYFTMARGLRRRRDGRRRDWPAGGDRDSTRASQSGGSISHHHGIGRLKADGCRPSGRAGWTCLRAVKTAIDPKGIMNPGALGL